MVRMNSICVLVLLIVCICFAEETTSPKNPSDNEHRLPNMFKLFAVIHGLSRSIAQKYMELSSCRREMVDFEELQPVEVVGIPIDVQEIPAEIPVQFPTTDGEPLATENGQPVQIPATPMENGSPVQLPEIGIPVQLPATPIEEVQLPQTPNGEAVQLIDAPEVTPEGEIPIEKRRSNHGFHFIIHNLLKRLDMFKQAVKDCQSSLEKFGNFETSTFPELDDPSMGTTPTPVETTTVP